MFTGIVEELGRVRRVERRAGGARLEFDADVVLGDAEIGASVAVNGCCVTVVEIGDGWWAADAMIESLERTALGELQAGDAVNLERPLRLSDRLGGHLVQGHVDAVGLIESREPLADGSARVVISAPPELLRYVIEKGSITVDGVSMTVTAVDGDRFGMAVVPHTLEVTTLGLRQPGDPVNLEVDMLAKYVERLLNGSARQKG